jgi:hypothetical protein
MFDIVGNMVSNALRPVGSWPRGTRTATSSSSVPCRKSGTDVWIHFRHCRNLYTRKQSRGPSCEQASFWTGPRPGIDLVQQLCLSGETPDDTVDLVALVRLGTIYEIHFRRLCRGVNERRPLKAIWSCEAVEKELRSIRYEWRTGALRSVAP